MKKSLLFLSLCVVLVACKKNITDVPLPKVSTSYQWKSSTLQAQQVDSVLLDSALQAFSSREYLYAFVLVRNSFLVKEMYRNPFTPGNDFELRSATKSFISALVGIALKNGLIDSISQTMISFFPEYDSPALDPRTRTITIKDLLTMRAGFNYSESNPNTALYSPTSNWVKTTIELPLLYDPGTTYNYSSVQAHLLSAILTKVSGMSTLEFGSKYLFTPAHISVKDWYTDPQGIYFGGAGISMKPRDMARFGDIYVHNGVMDGTLYFPREWISQTVQPSAERKFPWRGFSNVNYGFLWWTNTGIPDSLFFAAGSGGQYIIVVPSKNAVIVTTANANVTSSAAAQQEDDIADIISRFVIPSLK